MKLPDGGDFRSRWSSTDGQQLSKEVWRRLAAKESLGDLKLGEYEGRLDLRGLSAPEVRRQELPPFRNWALNRLSGYLEFNNVELEGVDFSGSKLEHIRFFNSRIVNCRFDDADCRSWRVKGTDVKHVSFVRSNLRDAVLGAWYEGRGSRYEFVNFSRADMRGLLSSTAAYLDCDFSYARLDKIDFQSSSFIRCRFSGELREVIFYSKTFDTKKPEPNPMEDVDFSDAKLRWVEFRRLNLDRVRFPEDHDHLVVKNYRCVLQRALEAASREKALESRGVIVVLKHRLKWVGPEQKIGVFNRLDFREAGGAEEENFAVDLLRRAERDCVKVL